MVTKTSETKGTDRRLLRPVAAAGVMILAVAVFALWRDYQLAAGDSLLGRFTLEAVGLLPASLKTAAAAQARAMGLPLVADTKAYWYMARAGGIVAYVLLWLATCWGIMMSSKVIKGVVSVPVAYALHQYLPILGVVFVALHAVVLLGDTYIDFKPWQLLVPFTGPYQPFWTGLGILAFYLFVALIASFYVRKRIGQKTWRALHYTSYLAFLIALAHGVMAGTDSGSQAMRALYLITGGLSVFLVLYRMLAYAPKTRRSAAAAGSGD